MQSASYVVQYDVEVLEKRLLGALLDLQAQVERGAWREAAGEGWLKQLRDGIAAVKTRLSRPFCLLVVGDFKRGKSTLVNALLRQELVTTDVAPETVVITELNHGPELKMELHLADGGRVRLRQEDLPSASLTRIMEQLPGPVDILKIEAPIPFLEGLAIVDSPGTGDLLWRFDRRVQDYLPRADAILHVVSALSPLSDTERAFLRLSLRPLELPKLSFVVNQVDLMPSEVDTRRVLDRIRESLRSSFPDSPVLGVSALQELCGLTGEALPRPERKQFLEKLFISLRDHLDNAVLFHRDVVRGERAAHDAIVLLRRSEELLGQQRRLLEQDRGKLRDALEEAKNQNSVAHQAILKKRQETVRWIEQLADEANGWMAGLLERLRERSFPEFEQLSQEQLQKNVPFFFSQVVRDGMAACFDAHQDAILARVEDCSVQSARSLVGGITDGTEVSGAVDHATFHTPAWTFFDHLHVVGALLGGITGLIAPLLAGLADRGLAEEQRAAHYRAAVRNAFPNLERQVKEGVLRAYQELAARVDHQLAGELEMEQERLQATLSGALAVHDRGAERVHEAARTLMEVAEAVAATRVLLEDLRSRLRGVEGSHGL